MNPQLGARVGCWESCMGCSFGCLVLLALPILVCSAIVMIVRKR